MIVIVARNGTEDQCDQPFHGGSLFMACEAFGPLLSRVGYTWSTHDTFETVAPQKGFPVIDGQRSCAHEGAP